MLLGESIREGPLTFCQELLLYSEIFTGRAPTVTRVARIDGPLDTKAFERAADATIAAHEPLRTTWAWRNDEPVAQIKSAKTLPSSTMMVDLALDSDTTALGAALAAPSRFGAMNPPHLRHWLYRRAEDNNLWCFSAHHMAVDAISLKLYGETFRATYQRSSDVPLSTTSIEYAQTQRTWLTTPAAQEELVWWLRKLGQLPSGKLPVRAPSTPSDVAFERQELRLPDAVRTAVVRAARRERVPPAAVFIAAYTQAVSQRSGVARHSVFMNLPGRSLFGAGSTSGACYNSVPFELVGATDASSAIAAAAEVLFEALDRQEVPAPLISLGCVRQGGAALSDRAPITFNVIDHPLSSFRLRGCRLWEVDLDTLGLPKWGHSGPILLQSGQAPTKPSMDWIVAILQSSVVLSVEYPPSYADREDVSSLLAEYENTLRILCGESAEVAPIGNAGLIADWSGSS